LKECKNVLSGERIDPMRGSDNDDASGQKQEEQHEREESDNKQRVSIAFV
jgi:hypothetical protein